MTQRRIGPWTVQSASIAYDNPWICVRDHRVARPDGSPGQYGVVHFKHLAIGILPIDSDGVITLVGQHRFPLDAYSWELPEGGGALGEDPLAAAKRELEEETGYGARDWFKLAECDLSNSVTDERSVCYLAWNLEPGPARPDASEALSHRRMRFSALHEMVLCGDISDALTKIMALSAEALARRGRLPPEAARLILGEANKEIRR